MKCCGFGGCSFSFIYILLTALLFFLKSFILSFGDLYYKYETNIFWIKPVLAKHGLMKLLIEYLGYIIYGGIFLHILRKKNIFKKKQNENEKKNLKSNNQLIYRENYLSFRPIKMMLIACCLFAIQLIIRSIMSFLNLWMLDLWIFNIIFIPVFMKKIMKIDIYKHQLYSLIAIFFINLALLISASFINDSEGHSDFSNVSDNFGTYSIIFFYLVFLVLSALICLSQVMQKYLMDCEYVSSFQILFIIGIFSIFFTLIALIITSSVNCNKDLENVCSIFVNKTDSHYFDSFKIYANNLRNEFDEDKVSFFIEIFLVYPLYSLACYLKYFFETLIIYHLNPIYVLLSDNAFYSVKKIVTLFNEPTDLKTYLKLFGEIIALFGYFIYLEIIQFNCCEMNFNTRMSINERSKIESLGLYDNYDDDDGDDDDDEQNDNNNEIKNNLIKKENEMVEIKPNNDDNCDNNDK